MKWWVMGGALMIVISAVVTATENSPSPPTRIEAWGEVGQARIRWSPSPSPGVWGYEVARSNEHAAVSFTVVTIEPTRDTVFVEALPIAPTPVRYFYQVRAVDMQGTRGPWSIPVSVTLPDIVPPTSPQLEEVIPGDGIITLRWSQAARDRDVARFYLYRREGDRGTDVLVTPEGLSADVREYVDSSVRAGVFYGYRVVAVDSAGNRSKPSRRISAQCFDSRTPPVPEVDTLIVTADGVTITWHYIGYVAEGTVAIVERSNNGETFFPISPLLPATTSRYTDGSAEITEAYYYRVVLRAPSGVYGKPSVARASAAARRLPLKR